MHNDTCISLHNKNIIVLQCKRGGGQENALNNCVGRIFQYKLMNLFKKKKQNRTYTHISKNSLRKTKNIIDIFNYYVSLNL